MLEFIGFATCIVGTLGAIVGMVCFCSFIIDMNANVHKLEKESIDLWKIVDELQAKSKRKPR